VIVYRTEIPEWRLDALKSQAEAWGFTTRPPRLAGTSPKIAYCELVSTTGSVTYWTSAYWRPFLRTKRVAHQAVVIEIRRTHLGGCILTIRWVGSGIPLGAALGVFLLFLGIWVYEALTGRLLTYSACEVLGMVGVSAGFVGCCWILSISWIKRCFEMIARMKRFAAVLERGDRTA